MDKRCNKTSVNVTPAQHVTEFGKDTFCVEGDLLWCKVCDVPVHHVRRQTVLDHVRSQKHDSKRAKRQAEMDASSTGPAPKCQATITGAHQRVTAASAAKEKLVLDLVEAFMSANIPLDKLDNPKLREFLKTSVKGGGGVPLANQLRECYVPKIYAQKQQEIQSKLQQQKIAVIVDETSDVMGQRSHAAIGCVQWTSELEQVDNSTMAQVVIRSLANLNIGFNDVLTFVSDNAAYMKKCFMDGLKGILPNAVHITCWAHIVFLVGEEFRTALQLTDNLVATVKAIFFQSSWTPSSLLESSTTAQCRTDFIATSASRHSMEYMVPSGVISR